MFYKRFFSPHSSHRACCEICTSLCELCSEKNLIADS